MFLFCETQLLKTCGKKRKDKTQPHQLSIKTRAQSVNK
jgi:hypothetical protein